jgi:predicted ABC-type ATPase
VINYVRSYKTDNGPIDFGYYINADDIGAVLQKGSFDLSVFDIAVTNKEFIKIAVASGLINESFAKKTFTKAYTLINNKITLKDTSVNDRLAQIIADYLRKKLLKEHKRFSFETVFSHKSKLDIMREAKDQGYKVYLYFVSTESPEINKARVASRKAQGGHDVPDDLIEKRYYRSLDFLYEACQIAYQAFFFDNSTERESSQMFAHFKVIKTKKKWDKIDKKNVPEWFRKYYSAKVKKL